MKKIIVLFLLTLVWNSFANWQGAINQENQKAQNEKIKVLNENFKLEKFTTKDQFEKIIIDKMYDKIIKSCNYNIYLHPLYRTMELWVANDSIAGNTVKSASVMMKKIWGSADKVSYGKTNLQKENVDEPEILKLTKNYIAYFNKKEWKIYIISSPVSWNNLDLSKVKISDIITIPKLINKYNVKLFFVNNQLIVMWNRYSQAFWWEVTDLVFYKIINWKAKFKRLYDAKWNFKDARIVNNKIYLITDYSFSSIARNICKNYISNPIEKDINIIRKKYQTQINEEYKKNYKERNYKKIDELSKTMNQEIKSTYDKQIKNLNKEKILEDIKKWISQKAIDIFIDKNAKFKFKWKIYPIQIRLTNSALNNILFIPTNFDKLSIYDLKFNLVNIVDIDTKQNPNQYIIFGNMSNGQIHMTTKSLYLVNNYYEWSSWRCRPWLMCLLPFYPRWSFTLIHKLSINGFNLNYVNSQIVPWQPINQYSMDEDSDWNFRIFTKHYYPSRATDLYTFDKKLNLEWKLQWIAKWEDFKSSRFIWDKAYLVTFKATDPLFVIDLQDNNNPKIIWELKIPWYSLYLHPLEKVWNIQYLLWIWQQAEEVHWNRSLPKNIKLDIYKIDYSKKVKDKILIKQLYSTILWDEKKVWNWWSYSPVFDNPRSFVYDKNLKTLLLPVYLTKDKIEHKCYPKYNWENGKRFVNWQRCYDYIKKIPYFVWIKWFKININSWFTEILSKNYIDKYNYLHKIEDKRNPYYYGNWLNKYQYKNEDHRVSYYTNWKKFIPFEINNNFFDMFKWKEDNFIAFNSLFKQIPNKSSNNTLSKKCFYKKPAPGTITCQMYCGKRWIVENNKCSEITVDAACSCPWFDTKDLCKTNCEK